MSPFPEPPVRAVGPMRLVVSSYPDRESAVAAARAALERRLAACVQISAVESRYWWKGALETAPEWVALFKTAPKRVGALFALLRSTHPYGVPEILEIDVPRVDAGYLRYLAATVDATAVAPPDRALTRPAARRVRAARAPRRTRARPHRPSR